MSTDIGILCYGRQKYYEQCIESIQKQTKAPYNLFVANNFCPSEPEMANYQKHLLENKIIKGLILIEGNIFSRGFDLLYQYFVKSDPFVMTDSDLILPKVDYCWLDYMKKVLETDSSIGYLTIRPSLCNAGSTDEEIFRRTNYFKSIKEAQYYYNDYVVHPIFSKIGLGLPTGILFQMFRKSFYQKYIKKNKTFGCDFRIRIHAHRRHLKRGVLLDDCIHLAWEDEEYYPHYSTYKKGLIQQGYGQHWTNTYPNTHYRVLYEDRVIEGIT